MEIYMKGKVVAIGVALTFAIPLMAQSSGHGGMQHGQPGQMQHQMPNDPSNPYMQAEMRMHERMMAARGDGPAETWVRKMIEHHRGAIEMSQIVIARANDREVERKARQTITEQQREIQDLQRWLRRQGKRPQ